MINPSEFETDAENTLQGFRKWWRSLRLPVKVAVAGVAAVIVLVVLRWVV